MQKEFEVNFTYSDQDPKNMLVKNHQLLQTLKIIEVELQINDSGLVVVEIKPKTKEE